MADETKEETKTEEQVETLDLKRFLSSMRLSTEVSEPVPMIQENLQTVAEEVSDEDRFISGAMTDPKGDRSMGPANQPDPDQYVHVVERNPDGLLIRGAKLHMTGGVNSHEILVMPTTAMDDRARDYAISCAVPVDAPGVTMIFGRQASDDRRDKRERPRNRLANRNTAACCPSCGK